MSILYILLIVQCQLSKDKLCKKQHGSNYEHDSHPQPKPEHWKVVSQHSPHQHPWDKAHGQGGPQRQVEGGALDQEGAYCCCCKWQLENLSLSPDEPEI